MKKLLLVLFVACTSLAASAQGYYYYQTTGITKAQFLPFTQAMTGIWTKAHDANSSGSISSWQSFPSGFTFDFYGQQQTGFAVTKQGYLTFDKNATSGVSGNTTLPDATDPNNSIYAFWDDNGSKVINANATTTIWYWTDGTAPNRTLQILWLYSIPASGAGLLDFGLTLHEGSSDFETFYIYSDNGTAIGATGTSATVGCENNDGSIGSEVSTNYTFPKTANGDPKVGTNIHFKYGTQPDFDGSVLSTTLKEVEKNGTITVGGGFVNYGKTAITSMDINYSIDGGAAVTQNVTGLNIAANGGGVYNFSHSTAWTGQTSGKSYSVKVWASNFNTGGTDGDVTNDEFSTNVFINDGISTPRTTLFEEGSGAWCGYCVDGHRIMADIKDNISNVIPVVHHNGDGMTNTESDKVNSTFAAGYPSGWVDRTFWEDQGAVGINRGAWEDKITDALNKPSPVKVSITNKSFDNTTRTVSFTVEAEFVDYFTGDIRINSMVVEDKVRGKNTQNTWTQHNYYALGIDPSNPLASEPEWLVGYLHRHVVRNIPSGAWGTSGVIPSTAKPGDKFSQTYTYKLPKEVSVTYTGNFQQSDLCDQTNGVGMNKALDISLIGFVSVFDANSVKKLFVLNATQESSLWANGVSKVQDNNIQSNIYPNPVTDIANLEFSLDKNANVTIEVVNALGQKVKTLRNGTFTSGTHVVYFNNEGLENGVYFLNIITDGQTSTKRFTVIK